MSDHTTTTTTSAPNLPRRRRRVAIAVAGLAGTVALVTGPTTPAEASTSTCAATAHPTGFQSAVAGANTALTKALTNLGQQHYLKAAHQLRVMKNQARNANTAAVGLIGKPPTDPESDDPPGPAAVQKVGAFDHKVTMMLVPLFSTPRGHHVNRALGRALTTVDGCRDVMLGAVIAARPAVRDDYVDGLSDTLPTFTKELTTLSTALGGTALTTAGRASLVRAQGIVSATDAAMQSVFGGGERTPHLPR